MNIQLVDLKGQYTKIQQEIDAAVLQVVRSGYYINGAEVDTFAEALRNYTGAKHVIPCSNGTDALQMALMALELKPGDEVIVPAFTYVAPAEAIGLLGLMPVMVDVDPDSFNVTAKNIEKGISAKTKAIIAVHLFGQSCDMASIMALAKRNHLYVIEDNAQSIGAWYTIPPPPLYDDWKDKKQTGTLGHIGCTSFFPTKNLGCYGDGGAMMTNGDDLAQKLTMIANHGQKQKYHHEVLGCNSRLDTLQAAILNVKLKHLDDYTAARQKAAQIYTQGLKGVEGIVTPKEMSFSTHVYHQYTIKVEGGKRDALKHYLAEQGIPTMIYYPSPLQEQPAFKYIARAGEPLTVAKELSQSVLSLPMHTELTAEQQTYIIDKIKKYQVG
ncbi:MAG: DegT/DnrJ/EryC1/StrS family aminotransferase [Candidatus Symbiothrix sp.]|jgi:dTDP-4-amino-4,6-dideoxygalactose transaminase|nr:DegT/DnrJ/EryC1/StrS family aminotransferase [Candidatus Symbiothrix sp.]